MAMLPDSSIYDGIENLRLTTDLQGWNSTYPVFSTVISEVNPGTIIEVGSWKGASAIHMATVLKRRAELIAGHPSKEWNVICVDTWLGSIEHWLRRSKPGFEMSRVNGYPQIYFQFLHNVKACGFSSKITPIPLPSGTAAKLLSISNYTADLVYIDASHEYCDVLCDIKNYWELLNDGGIIFGDDWGQEGVSRAVIEWGQTMHISHRIMDGKFWVFKKNLAILDR